VFLLGFLIIFLNCSSSGAGSHEEYFTMKEQEEIARINDFDLVLRQTIAPNTYKFFLSFIRRSATTSTIVAEVVGELIEAVGNLGRKRNDDIAMDTLFGILIKKNHCCSRRKLEALASYGGICPFND